MTNLEIQNAYIGSDQADKIYLGADVVWQNTPPTPVPYDEQYFTIEVLSLDPDIPELEPELFPEESDISISINGEPWTEIAYGEPQTLAVGDKVRFKKEAAFQRSSQPFTLSFCRYAAYGNIESMEYGDNFSGQTAVRAQGAFKGFFKGSPEGLVTAENLILPATTLQRSCYESMFDGCTNLTSAPVLPATPSGIVNECYSYMFKGCTNLNTITCLATNTTSYYYRNWVQGVSSTGTFYKASSVTWPTGNNGVPSGWTVVDYVEPNN